MNILFYPAYPDKEYYSLSLIMHRLGYTATLDTQADIDAVFIWCDKTWVDVPAALRAAHAGRPFINGDCTDISKRHVDAVCQKVFGYGSLLDPTRHLGSCVQKPDENAVKGGRIVTAPLVLAQPGMVYQRLIRSGGGDLQVEYRVPIVLGAPPLVYEIHQEAPRKSLDHRPQQPPLLRVPEEIFSPAEMRDILAFCAAIHLDFGELDILRCRESQRLYVLDANKTPAGYGLLNRFNWRHMDRHHALDLLAGHFADRLERRVNGIRMVKTA